jgi:hypothetical protein
MKDSWDITDATIAKALTDISQLRILAVFVGEMTLSEASKKLDIKMTTLLYHVHRWVKLGILEVSREEARKGKAIKYYQASSKVFFVPFSLTPSENLKTLLSRVSSPFNDLFDREMSKVLQEMSNDWLVKIIGSQDNEGRHDINFTLVRADRKDLRDSNFDVSGPALVSSYGVIEMDFATAKAFEKEMLDLLKRYTSQQIKNGQSYAYHIGLTPVTDTSFVIKD